MIKWQYSGISQKKASEILKEREDALKSEWERNQRQIKEAMSSGAENSNKGDLVDQIRWDFRALTKKQENCVKCLEKIRVAQRKIADGSFGICEICEEKIPIGRIKIRPESPVCVSCKNSQEMRENIRKRPTKIFISPQLFA